MTVSRVRSTVLCLMMMLFFATAVVSTAGASLTPISYPGNGEPWLDWSLDGTSVLETLYGAGNFVRVDDSLDQLWWEYDGTAVAEAKYAGYKHEIGYTKGTAGGVTQLFATSGNGYGVSGGFTFDFNPDDFLRFNLLAGPDEWTGDLWSSSESENVADGSNDHMVSYLITGLGGLADAEGRDPVGHYVIAWEDLRLTGGSDKDYNDMVIEVAKVEPSQVPEPGSLILVGLVLLGAGARFFAPRRQR